MHGNINAAWILLAYLRGYSVPQNKIRSQKIMKYRASHNFPFKSYFILFHTINVRLTSGTVMTFLITVADSV